MKLITNQKVAPDTKIRENEMKKLTFILMVVFAMILVSCGGNNKGHDYKPEVKGTFAEYYDVDNVQLSFKEGHNSFLNSEYIEIIAKFDIVKNDKDIKNEIGNLTPNCMNGWSSYSDRRLNDGKYRWGCSVNILDPQYTKICSLYDSDINP